MRITESATTADGAWAGSAAFRRASLLSEIRRAHAVIAVLVLVIGLLLLRGSREELPYDIQISASVGIAVLLVVQFGILWLARRAARRETGIPTWIVVLSVVVVCLVPTGMMASSSAGGSIRPYSTLSSPPIFGYGLLIGLTTLRLRPGLCLLAGAVSAAGYGGILAYVTYSMGIEQPTTGLPRQAYVNSALLVLISGVAAAWVAHEIRGHVRAALDEAETRRQMDRIEQDLVVARSIQRAVLPREAPSIAGFDIAGWNRPADQTGGDYYDWQMLPDGNWIVTVADVSGHGIGPALVTAACRAYVRASGEFRGDLPSLTSRVNRLLADDLPDGRFVTMASVLIDPRAGPLTLLSAGHGPIVLYVGATGVVQDILPHNLPLAIEPDASFGPAQTVCMQEGDILALVTDGFVEWSRRGSNGRGEEFGISRLRESLSRHAHLPAASMIEAITADVASFAHPSPQQDDLTVVIIRRVSSVGATPAV